LDEGRLRKKARFEIYRQAEEHGEYDKAEKIYVVIVKKADI